MHSIFFYKRFKGDNPSWLQKQQDKLRARREGKDWEEKHLKEQLMLEELRRTQKKVPNGESMEDVSLGLDFSSSSRETSPPKVCESKFICRKETSSASILL